MRTVPNPRPRVADSPKTAGRGGHGWMMICCVPMGAIAIALVAAGVASPTFLLTAGVCDAKMAKMMRTMDHGSGHDHM